MGFLTLGADMARPSRTGGEKRPAKTRKGSLAEGREPTRTKRHISAIATRIKGSRVSDLAKELKEAREQQAATAAILKGIASSPTDVQPVFEAIASSANRLLGGHSAAVMRAMEG